MIIYILAILSVFFFNPLLVFLCVVASGETWRCAFKAMLVAIIAIVLIVVGMWGTCELLNESVKRPVAVQAERP